jgi:gentisate 1,2-dioxygenase
MDVLDLPLTHLLHANFFAADYTEPGPDGIARPLRNQSVTGTENWSAHAFGTAGGVRPLGTPRREHGSVQLLYRYGPTRALLDKLRDEPDPHEGSIVEYYDPMSGGPVLRTVGVSMQLLSAGARTLPLRRTAGTVYCCLEGQGRTTVDGVTLDWAEKDIFVVPGWAWRQHEATAGDAVLYAVSDAPALHQLGLLYTERRDAGGAVHRRHG